MAGLPSSVPSLSDVQVVVPKTNKDPIWSLKPWPVNITIRGLELEIPAMPAVDWLVLLMGEALNLDDFVQELIPEAEDLLYETDLGIREMYDFCLEIIATVSARPWWVALRLIGVARDSWHILGPEMLRVDATRMSLAGWLDVLLLTILTNMKPEETTMFSMKLESPPVDVDVKPEELEMSADAFLRMAG